MLLDIILVQRFSDCALHWTRLSNRDSIVITGFHINNAQLYEPLIHWKQVCFPDPERQPFFHVLTSRVERMIHDLRERFVISPVVAQELEVLKRIMSENRRGYLQLFVDVEFTDGFTETTLLDQFQLCAFHWAHVDLDGYELWMARNDDHDIHQDVRVHAPDWRQFAFKNVHIGLNNFYWTAKPPTAEQKKVSLTCLETLPEPKSGDVWVDGVLFEFNSEDEFDNAPEAEHEPVCIDSQVLESELNGEPLYVSEMYDDDE